ncbi:Cof-type HAD-IIB family hydrolase, partial [Gemmiger formicilis]|uniref:Cof-type HAD-IIB family hydrolase n=1 Tax=Gemmiger formicilis TaxID=745368 RepID=UPI0029420989
MAQIKAAFFDIDGTLLPFHAKALPESTVQALAALRKNGVKTFIATGRPPVHLPYLHALDGIPFDGYVTMNGQYCYLANGELLYTKYIPAASLQTLLPYIEKEQLSVGFVGKDFCRFNLINDLSRDFAKKLELGAGDVAALIQHEDIYQLSAFLPPEKEAEFLRRCPGCLAVRWEDDFCDILPAGGGKPNGLAHTLAHLGLTREQSIAFGDGGNDVTMLEYAGIGVAMGNASVCQKTSSSSCATTVRGF